MCTKAGPTCTKVVTVQNGQTCYTIWTANGITDAEFYSLNPSVDCAKLQPGQSVCVAGSSSCKQTHTVAAGDTCAAFLNSNVSILSSLHGCLTFTEHSNRPKCCTCYCTGVGHCGFGPSWSCMQALKFAMCMRCATNDVVVVCTSEKLAKPAEILFWALGPCS